MASGTSDLAPAPNLSFEFADLVGKPFQLGARGPHAFDCYGLLMTLARRAGVTLPDHTSPEALSGVAQQVLNCVSVWTPCEPGPGAVVTLRTGRYVSHVGMVLPYDRFIHSWARSGGVCTERLSAWAHRIDGYYRFIEKK